MRWLAIYQISSAWLGNYLTSNGQVSKTKANALSVHMKLQADCLVGVWINQTENHHRILEQGDIEEGLAAAVVMTV